MKKKNTKGTALKYDNKKPQLDLIPYEAIEEIGKVLTAGAIKYERNNWRAGFKYSRLISAALRHIGQYNSGEDVDAETNTLHLANAAVNLIFLIYFIKQGKTELDDRYKGEKRDIAIKNKTSKR